MNRRDRAALVLRERRAELEQALLNRAMRHDKSPLDRLATRAVQTKLADTSATAPTDAGILDRPARPKSDVVSSDVVADQIVNRETPTMTEPTVTATTTVAAPAETVYALVSDLPRMGEWSPENTGGRWVGRRRGPVVGARFVGTNRGPGRWWPTTTLVTAADPGRRFTFETRLGPLAAAAWSYDIAPTDGGCRVTESWTDGRPGWLTLVGKYLTGVDDRVDHTRHMLETTLDRLRTTAESRRSNGS